MGDESYQSYRDDRSRVIGTLATRDREVQAKHLESVSARIGKAIIEFMRGHAGQEFHAEDVRRFVETRCGTSAPGSADRVMRDLRKRDEIAYTVVNRAKSLYRCGP